MKSITFKLNIPKESNLVNMCTGMVHHASEFTSEILLSVDNGNQIDLKSILGIMSLCMSNGKIITIDIAGKDEDLAFMCLEKYASMYKE